MNRHSELNLETRANVLYCYSRRSRDSWINGFCVLELFPVLSFDMPLEISKGALDKVMRSPFSTLNAFKEFHLVN